MNVLTLGRMLPLAVIAFCLSSLPAQAQQLTEFSIPVAPDTTTHNHAQRGETVTLAQSSRQSIQPTNNYSYIGVGGNVGLGENDRGVAESGVSIISKVAIARNVSFRPSVVFGDDTVFMVPLTYDFPIKSSDGISPSELTPYLGAGVAISAGDDEDTSFLVTGGVDYRFAENWVGNVGLNVDFADDTDVGILFGVGYAFPHR